MPLGATQESDGVSQESEGKRTVGENLCRGFCGKEQALIISHFFINWVGKIKTHYLLS